MTEQELLQEVLEWREHISKLANDYSDQELFRKRLETFDWLIKQAERVQELEKQNKRYKQALEYIQTEIREAIYTPKNNKWNSDFEREFEKGKTRGLIQASDIVKKAIRKLEG